MFEHIFYDELMDGLLSAWRRIDAPQELATDDGYWVHTLQIVFDELKVLGLSKPILKPALKKRGRKPKPKNQPE